ncbi:MAG: hypothetical protein AAFY46_10465, partial [Planctomycetota bacterium]
MRNVVRNLCLVAGLLVLAVWSISPPSEKLRQGKDLRGGFSLVYQLQIDATEDASAVMSRTITVLKDRVDPQGLLEISIVPQGRDRIEITMPLPSDEVKALRADYVAELDRIAETELSARDVERLMSTPRGERRVAAEAIVAGDESRRALFDAVILATEEVEETRERLQMAEDAGAPDDEKLLIVQELAAAEIRRDQARDAVLGSVLRAEQLRNALQLSSEPRFVLDDDADEPFEIPSPRSRAIAELKELHPDKLDVIDGVIQALATYEAARTTLDDPNDLIRLLQGSGVLEFRIAPRIGEHPDEQQLRE